VYAPTENNDDIYDTFYKEPQQAFDQFPKYNVKSLLGDINAKVWQEEIFKPTIRNGSLHEISNNNRVTVVNFAM
jgi:hypothetical protein